jgi:hypothetical protein
MPHDYLGGYPETHLKILTRMRLVDDPAECNAREMAITLLSP